MTAMVEHKFIVQANRTLTSLDLSWNKIGPEGVVLIGDALKVGLKCLLLSTERQSLNECR